jgi:hypothetical protein
MFPRRRSRSPYSAAVCGLLLLLAQPCYAAHWQEVGLTEGRSVGRVYVDLDSLRQEGLYRVAVFLTIYANIEHSAHDVPLDRISQKTAFDCKKRTFSLLSTAGYFQGKQMGMSSDKGDWRTSFKPVPLDAFSQEAYEVACTSHLAPHGEAAPTPEDAPGSVKLPGPS